MKISDAAIRIAENYKTKPYFCEQDPNKDFQISEKFVNKALQTICEFWNKDIKSRNFIKHLVNAFIPINEYNKIANVGERKIKDCLTGMKLTGIMDIAKQMATIKTKQLFYNASVIANGADSKTTKEIRKDILVARNDLPVEIRNMSFAYYSDDSDKYISRETATALILFSQEMIMCNDNELYFIVKKKMVKRTNDNLPKEKQFNKKQETEITRAIVYNNHSCIDDDTRNKLLSLKNELE